MELTVLYEAGCPLARGIAMTAAGLRAVITTSDDPDYPDCRDGTCEPALAQG